MAQRDSTRGDGYEYDLTQQITKFHQDGIVDLNAGTVSSPTTDNVMEFDGCGNRKSLNGTPQAYNSMNQPADVPHDNNGNVQIYNGWTYTYDAQNRLRSAANPTANQLTQFWYDGLNRQCARASGPYAAPTPSPSPSVSPSVSPLPSLSPLPSVSPLPTVPPTPSPLPTVPKPKDILPSPTPTPTPPQFDPPNAAPSTPNAASPPPTVVVFSVWDGDWALLEEYGPNNAITQKYLQGYHGLVKTLQGNIYYYQDSLGSTSHIANVSGNLLEWYKYNLYGLPTYWNASTPSSQLQSSSYQIKDLHGGARWVPEIGLYDDRNRFMSPELGRFLQPDPIGFKGDASNLYRYCANDWANKTDPMGTEIVFRGDIGDWRQARAYLMQDSSMRQIIKQAESKQVGKIFIVTNNRDDDQRRNGVGGQNVVRWDPHSGLTTTEGGRQSPAFGLGHELDHAVRYATDRTNYLRDARPHSDKQYDTREERRVIQNSEANAAKTLGEDRRFDHKGDTFRTNSPTSRQPVVRNATYAMHGTTQNARSEKSEQEGKPENTSAPPSSSSIDLSNDGGGGIGAMVHRIGPSGW